LIATRRAAASGYRAGDVCPATGWYQEHVPGDGAYVDDLGHDRAVLVAAGTRFPPPSRATHVWRIAIPVPAAAIPAAAIPAAASQAVRS